MTIFLLLLGYLRVHICNAVLSFACNWQLFSSFSPAVAENERRLAEAQQDREEIQRRIEKNIQVDREQERKVKERNLRHQADLLQQIGYNQRWIHIFEPKELFTSQTEFTSAPTFISPLFLSPKFNLFFLLSFLRQREITSAEEDRMLRFEREAELEYNRKLEGALADEEIWGVHPFRRAINRRRGVEDYCLRRGHQSAPIFS